MYLLPKPKTIKEQDGQMLLCHSTHIVMTKEVAETEMHAAKRLQEAIRQETGLILPFSVGEVREGDLSLGIAKTLPEQTYEITIDEKGGQISGGDGAGVLYGVERQYHPERSVQINLHPFSPLLCGFLRIYQLWILLPILYPAL